MKLKELLEEILLNNPMTDDDFGFDGSTLYGKQLKPYKEKILQCEEFSECSELHFMEIPMILSQNDEPIKPMSYKLLPGQKFKGVCYLLSLNLSPEMFDPNTLYTPVKDGACITPLVYNPETFTPIRKIVLEYSPERAQDGLVDEHDVKMEIRSLLDKVLDSPDDYKVKGERGVIVRGVFEKNEVVNEVEPPQNLTGVKTFVDNEKTPGIAYYLSTETIKDGETNINVKHKLIPAHLKNLFEETFQNRGINLTEEEINKFLEENS